MGRRLIRERDQEERALLSIIAPLGEVFFGVADKAAEQGVPFHHVHSVAWGMRGHLSPEQLMKLRCYLVEECGAVVTGVFSCAEGVTEDLRRNEG